MAKVIVTTDDGQEVWSYEGVESWHVASIIHGHFTNVVCRNVTSGILRAVQDAEAIQAGRDPERPSEKAMRLMHEAREREKIDG